MTVVVVAEKPSAAADIARALGLEHRDADAWRGPDLVVTWLVGHVAELAEPGSIQARWRSWRAEDLPILPQPIPWRVTERGQGRFDAVGRCCRAPGVTRIVNAADAGREGELLFRVAMDLLDVEIPVERLWVSSLTPAAIRAGFERLRPEESLIPLGRAALARAWADWWIGMNASRALTLVRGRRSSAGRVQTPTLGLVLERERERRAFVPVPFVERWVHLRGPDGASWSAVQVEGDAESRRLDPAAELPPLGGSVRVVEVAETERSISAPRLYDLDHLQRAASEFFGWSARRTLEVAQSLYEQYKLLSYPRTDSQFLTEHDALELEPVLARIALGRGVDVPGPLQGVVDPGRVGDHPALVPTENAPPEDLPEPEAALLDLVERRLLAAVGPPARMRDRTVSLLSDTGVRLHAADSRVETAGGWSFERSPPPALGFVPEGLSSATELEIEREERVERSDSPPPRLRDGDVLAAMVERGLGTPATRADVIEGLVERGYVERGPEGFVSTPDGEALYDACPPRLVNPESTARLEAGLTALARDERGFSDLLAEVEHEVGAMVAEILTRPEPRAVERSPLRLESDEVELGVLDLEGLEAVRREGVQLELEAELSRVEGPTRLVTLSSWSCSRYVLGDLHARRALFVAPGPRTSDELSELRQAGLAFDGAGPRTLGDPEPPPKTNLPQMDLFGPRAESGPRPAAVDPDGSEAGWRDEVRNRLSGRAERLLVQALGLRSELESEAVELGFGSAALRMEPLEVGGLALEVAPADEVSLTSLLGRMGAEGQLLLLVPEGEEARWAERTGLPAACPGEAERVQRWRGFLEGNLGGIVACDAELDPRRPIPDLRSIVFLPKALPLGLHRFARRALGPTLLEAETRVVVLTGSDGARSRAEQCEWVAPPEAAVELALRADGGLGEGSRARHLALLERVASGDLARYARWRRRRMDDLARLEAWLAAPGCRAQALLRAMGWEAGEPCGACERCDPDGALARHYRAPSEADLAGLRAIWTGLRGGPQGRSALFRAVQGTAVPDRARFQRWVEALVSAGLVGAEVARFERGGETQRYEQLRRIAPRLELAWIRLPHPR